MKKQWVNAGFSLVEFLIAIVISLLLMVGVITAYLSQKKTYQLAQGLERMQENGRLATQYLRKEICMAGYVGCGRLTEINLQNPFTKIDFNLTTALVGFHQQRSTNKYFSTGLASTFTLLKPGTDLLLLQEASSEAWPAHGKDQQISLQSKANFKVGNLLLISNCGQGNFFQVAKIQKSILQTTLPLAMQYQSSDSQVSRFLTIVYYVAATGRKNLAGNEIYALYRRDLNDAATRPNELLEGVDDLQIQYGVALEPGGPLHFYTAAQVPDWQKIRLVQLALLLTSVQALADAPQSYRFQKREYLAKDRCLHREWDISVALRER